MDEKLLNVRMVRLLINSCYDNCNANVITFYTRTRRYISKALSTIFDLVPRIALGSIIAYIIGQHVDVFIFSMIKSFPIR